MYVVIPALLALVTPVPAVIFKLIFLLVMLPFPVETVNTPPLSETVIPVPAATLAIPLADDVASATVIVPTPDT